MIAHPTEAWEHLKFKDTIAKLTNTEIFYKAITFYLDYSPLEINSLLEAMASRVDHVRVISQMKRAGHLPLVKPYLLTTQPANIKEVNDALYALYVEDEDHEALAKGVVTFDNFDQVEMAQMCEKHSLLQFRRIGAMLYKRAKKWSKSVELSKKDKVWDEAIETTAESGDSAIAEELINFFVEQKLNTCFAAALYTCYAQLRPDVVMELAWRNNLNDFAMPFMVQTMREITNKLDTLVEKERKKEEAVAEEKKKAEEALASGYSDYGAGDPNAMVVYGAGGGMGGGVPQQMGGYGGGGGYGY